MRHLFFGSCERCKMKKTSTLGLMAAALLASAAANAADLTRYRLAAPPPPPPPFNWTGIYVGAQAGYSLGHDKTTEYLTGSGAFTGLSFKFNPDGAVAGIHAGGNYQIGSFVAGLEADAEAAGTRGGFSDAPAPPFNPGGVGRMRIDAQGSLRGRLGFAIDRAMIYGTGGLAVANIKYTFTNPTTGVSESTTRASSGYTLGGGVSYAITNNLIGSLEYRYTDFGTFRYTSTSAFVGLTGSQHPRSNAARVALGYKF